MYRRRMILSVGGYREVFRNAEDYDLWLRLAPTSAFLNVATPLTRYRLSLKGASLPRLREQRMYALLAKHTFLNPDTDLRQLLDELTGNVDETEMSAYLRSEYTQYTTQLVRLGHRRAALRLLVAARKDLGYTASLVIGRRLLQRFARWSA
jgi:hypothetical protein